MRVPRALERQEPIRERPDARGRSAGRGLHDGGSPAAGRAQLRQGVPQGVDLLRQIGGIVGGRRIDLGQFRREVQPEPQEVQTVGRGGQLPVERGPRGGRRGPRLSAEPRDLALLTLDRGLQLGATVRARPRPGGRSLAPAGRVRLGDERRAGAGRIEGALHDSLRRLLLAAIEVGVEDVAKLLHVDPRVLVPGERALEGRHHGFRRLHGRSSGLRTCLLSEDAVRAA